LIALGLIASSGPSARAIVGDAPLADETVARYAVMVYSARGGPCTGVVLAQDLVLTAAHCVFATAKITIVGPVAGRLFRLADVVQTISHPRYDLYALLAKDRAADLALLKLANPLRNTFGPAFLSPRPIPPRARLAIVGYGMSTVGDRATSGTARMTMLIVNSQSGDVLLLSEPVSFGGTRQLGGCGGDSGAPAFAMTGGVPVLVGIVWGGDRCGGITVVTPLWPYRDWLLETANQLGSPLTP
jgi:secreted trypsin-like serine protease